MSVVSANGSAVALSPNYIINGAFDIWQRGTSFSFSGTSGYTADRFQVTSGVSGVVVATQGVFDLGAEPVAGIGSPYFLNLNYTTSGSGAADNGQYIEDVRTLAGQTITVSIWAKVSTGTHSVTPQAVQRFGTGGSNAAATSGSAWTLTTSWQRFTANIVVPSVSGKTIGASSALQIRFDLGTTGVKQFQFWGFQVEAGSIATPFRRNANSIQGELAACQRYYQRWVGTGGGFIGIGFSDGGTYIRRCQVPTPVTMRSTPTISKSGSNVAFYTGNLTAYSGILGFENCIATTGNISFDVRMSSVPATNIGAHFALNGTVADIFEASAEL